VADLRVDPLSGRLVAVAPGRAGRPGANAARIDPPTDEELETCPFCEGREDQTPPEVLVLPETPGRAPNTPGWSVRVVPPATDPGVGYAEFAGWTAKSVRVKREAIVAGKVARSTRLVPIT